MTTTGDMKIALEEDLLTLDANTGEKIRRPVCLHDVEQRGHLPLLPGQIGGRQPPLQGQRV